MSNDCNESVKAGFAASTCSAAPSKMTEDELVSEVNKALNRLSNYYTGLGDERRYLVNRAIKLIWECSGGKVRPNDRIERPGHQ